jgi:hypothetical protein
VSPHCRLSLAVAGPTAGEALRTRGHRDAMMRTGTIRPGTTPMSPGMTACGRSTRMTTPAGPDARARTLSTPITRAGGEGVTTRAGIARRRPCGRTVTPPGPSPRLRPGATPNRRRRTTLPAGAAGEDPRDKNRCRRRTAARTVGQLRAMLPGQDPPTLQVQDPFPGSATPRKASPPSRVTRLVRARLAQVRLPGPTSFPATDRRFSKGRPG